VAKRAGKLLEFLNLTEKSRISGKWKTVWNCNHYRYKCSRESTKPTHYNCWSIVQQNSWFLQVGHLVELSFMSTKAQVLLNVMQMAFRNVWKKWSKQYIAYCNLQKWGETLRHLGEDCSSLRSDLPLGHFSTSAKLSTQFGPTKIVPKCLGSEVTRVRSVRLPVNEYFI